jgi:hypothetical protein
MEYQALHASLALQAKVYQALHQAKDYQALHASLALQAKDYQAQQVRG